LHTFDKPVPHQRITQRRMVSLTPNPKIGISYPVFRRNFEFILRLAIFLLKVRLYQRIWIGTFCWVEEKTKKINVHCPLFIKRAVVR